GYAASDAKRLEDGNGPRMIHTPGDEDAIPVHDAAELGTRKEIEEHSTLGIVVTTDVSIGGISRNDYEEPENKVIEELKEVGRPFIMILNSTHPTEQSTELLRQELRETHDVPVIAMNVEMMNEHDVTNVLREALFEFPVLE